MPDAVTIDNYDVTIHKRYASDQAAYDPALLCDTSEIPLHLDIAVAKTHLVTKWEELFGVHLHYHPFAFFSPPPRYGFIRNRFFSHRLSPDLDWDKEKEDLDDDKEKNKAQKQRENYKTKIKKKTSKDLPLALLEKDKTVLLNLIDFIYTLNEFLKEIHAKKLQYQKG